MQPLAKPRLHRPESDSQPGRGGEVTSAAFPKESALFTSDGGVRTPVFTLVVTVLLGALIVVLVTAILAGGSVLGIGIALGRISTGVENIDADTQLKTNDLENMIKTLTLEMELMRSQQKGASDDV